MSGTPYIDADTLEDIRNAHAFGAPLQKLAAQHSTTADNLRRLLGLPQPQPEQPLQRSIDWTR